MQKLRLRNWRRSILVKYKVQILRAAYRDIDNIYRYIASEKLAPENAKSQVNRIKEAILGLDIFPYSHQDRLTGRYSGKGYKQLVLDNYVAIFRIDEAEKIVWVVTVQYLGRNI